MQLFGLEVTLGSRPIIYAQKISLDTVKFTPKGPSQETQ